VGSAWSHYFRTRRTRRDALPIDAAIAAMGLAEVVVALRAHVAEERVAAKACGRLRNLSRLVSGQQAAADAGAIEAVVEA
jgi:hypothetical protein